MIQTLLLRTAYALNAIGVRQMGRGWSGAAITALNQAIRLHSQLAPAYANRSLCYSARGDFARALEDANQAIAMAPESIRARDSRVYVSFCLQQFECAVTDLTSMIQLEPQENFTYLKRAVAWFHLGDHENAHDDFDRFFETSEAASGHYLRALAFVRTGELERALADIDLAVKLQWYNATYLVSRAEILCRMKRFDEAAIQCAAIQRHMERCGEAVAHCDSALARVPELTQDFLISGSAALRWEFCDANLGLYGIETSSDGMSYCDHRGYVRLQLSTYAQHLARAIKDPSDAPS